MDISSDQILDFIVLQKGLVDDEMEKPACDKLLTRLRNYGLFLSDRHRGIRKMMRDCYPDIIHEFDVWYICKSLAKKIKSVEKNAPGIEKWKSSILNHLWLCSKSCNGNEDELN